VKCKYIDTEDSGLQSVHSAVDFRDSVYVPLEMLIVYCICPSVNVLFLLLVKHNSTSVSMMISLPLESFTSGTTNECPSSTLTIADNRHLLDNSQPKWQHSIRMKILVLHRTILYTIIVHI